MHLKKKKINESIEDKETEKIPQNSDESPH